MSAKPKSSPLADSATNMILGQLYTNEVNDTRILEAMMRTPRESFVPKALHDAAYVDGDIDVGGGRVLLAPMTFAKLLNLAAITPECRVLDIGCLDGYSTAVLSKLAAHVVAIDTDADRIAQARQQLQGVGNIDLYVVKSLADGYASSAPYSVIVVEGAISFVPEALGLQLADGGRMVA